MLVRFKRIGIGRMIIRVSVSYDGAIRKTMTVCVEKAVERMNTHNYNQGNCDQLIGYVLVLSH